MSALWAALFVSGQLITPPAEPPASNSPTESATDAVATAPQNAETELQPLPDPNAPPQTRLLTREEIEETLTQPDNIALMPMHVVKWAAMSEEGRGVYLRITLEGINRSRVYRDCNIGIDQIASRISIGARNEPIMIAVAEAIYSNCTIERSNP